MELRHLRYFVAVAQESNFTRAAGRLRVAQPALSRQIRQLEEEVGVPLLKRGRKGVTLTEAGKAFLSEARALLAQSDNAVRVAQQAGLGGSTHLNVAYVWGLFHSLVPPLLERFRLSHPGVSVNLFDMTATQQVLAIQEGRIHLGFIGFAHEADTAGLSKSKVGTCAFVAALPRLHRAAKKARVPLRDLAQDFFLMISEDHYPGAARFVAQACDHAGFRPRILQTAERGYTILSLVAANCGVALLPEPLRALPHHGVVFRPLEEPPTGDLFVAWKNEASSPAREALLHIVDALPASTSLPTQPGVKRPAPIRP